MGRALLYGFLLLMAGFFLLPVYLVVLTALKEPARIMPRLVPKSPRRGANWARSPSRSRVLAVAFLRKRPARTR